MQKNICDHIDAPTLIPKEQGMAAFLKKIQNIRCFLKGQDEPVISKDLFQLLNSQYVYLPYILPGWRITGRRIRAGSQEIDISVANL